MIKYLPTPSRTSTFRRRRRRIDLLRLIHYCHLESSSIHNICVSIEWLSHDTRASVNTIRCQVTTNTTDHRSMGQFLFSSQPFRVTAKEYFTLASSTSRDDWTIVRYNSWENISVMFHFESVPLENPLLWEKKYILLDIFRTSLIFIY